MKLQCALTCNSKPQRIIGNPAQKPASTTQSYLSHKEIFDRSFDSKSSPSAESCVLPLSQVPGLIWMPCPPKGNFRSSAVQLRQAMLALGVYISILAPDKGCWCPVITGSLACRWGEKTGMIAPSACGIQALSRSPRKLLEKEAAGQVH